MTMQTELESLHATREELKKEASRLKGRQKELEDRIRGLEEKFKIQELNKGIEELETNNKAAKEAITKLQIKKNDLEAKLKELV